MKATSIFMIFIMGICSPFAFAQTNQNSQTDAIGSSVQVYPAGIITTIYILKSLENNNYINLRAGGNFANRKDFSPYNDFEKGDGFGITAGYRKNIQLKKGFAFLGANLDIWNMWIHWEDNIGDVNYTAGTSYTFVLQPWIELGYFFEFGKSPLQAGISTGFGREINVITKGEDVGQGWINSALLNLHYVLK